jgi:hypothetical protein
MKPKTSTLRHYRRKKFFYRLFLRRSPRSAGLFGLLWMVWGLSLSSLFFFLIAPETGVFNASIEVQIGCISLLLFVALS